MRRRCEAGIADLRDALSARDTLPCKDERLAAVRVERAEAFAVQDHHAVAEAGELVAAVDDETAARRDDRRSDRCTDVEALVSMSARLARSMLTEASAHTAVRQRKREQLLGVFVAD